MRASKLVLYPHHVNTEEKIVRIRHWMGLSEPERRRHFNEVFSRADAPDLIGREEEAKHLCYWAAVLFSEFPGPFRQPKLSNIRAEIQGF